LKLLNDLKGYSDYTVDELMEKYKPDIYSKEASHRLFDFNASKIFCSIACASRPAVLYIFSGVS